MREYALTVFANDGEVLLDETFTADNNDAAKEIGERKLAEHGYENQKHRCVSPEAKLLLFHR